jgi:hypothetical protein
MRYRETGVAADRRGRAFLGAVEVISRSLLQASDAGAIADVERMLNQLRLYVEHLTPWADARICTSCWHAIPPIAVVHPGRDHRGICATCWERQHTDAPDYIPSEN